MEKIFIILHSISKANTNFCSLLYSVCISQTKRKRLDQYCLYFYTCTFVSSWNTILDLPKVTGILLESVRGFGSSDFINSFKTRIFLSYTDFQWYIGHVQNVGNVNCPSFWPGMVIDDLAVLWCSKTSQGAVTFQETSKQNAVIPPPVLSHSSSRTTNQRHPML